LREGEEEWGSKTKPERLFVSLFFQSIAKGKKVGSRAHERLLAVIENKEQQMWMFTEKSAKHERAGKKSSGRKTQNEKRKEFALPKTHRRIPPEQDKFSQCKGKTTNYVAL